MNRMPKMAWIVIGVLAVGVALWALGVPGRVLLSFGFFGGMMLMHGGHGGHGGGSQGDQHVGHEGSDRLPEGRPQRPGGHQH